MYADNAHDPNNRRSNLRCYVGREAQDSTSSSSVSSHSRQIQSRSRSRGVRALSSAGTIVTPQAEQIGGRSSYTFEVCLLLMADLLSGAGGGLLVIW
jgi:hypothetical protein